MDQGVDGGRTIREVSQTAAKQLVAAPGGFHDRIPASIYVSDKTRGSVIQPGRCAYARSLNVLEHLDRLRRAQLDKTRRLCHEAEADTKETIEAWSFSHRRQITRQACWLDGVENK